MRSTRGERRYLIYPFAVLIVLLAAWQVATAYKLVSPLTLPPPQAVLDDMLRFARPLRAQTQLTLGTSVVGFGLAMVAGLVVAALVAQIRAVRLSVMPLLMVIQSLPKVALAPLFVFWLGFGSPSRVAIAFLISFFPIVVSTASGLSRVPPELIELSESLRASQLRTFFKIRFPHALPAYFAGLRVAAPLSVVGAVVGEFVSGANGLGYVVKSATTQALVSLSFVAIILLTTLGLLMYLAVIVIWRVVAPWSVTHGR